MEIKINETLPGEPQLISLHFASSPVQFLSAPQVLSEIFLISHPLLNIRI